MFRICNGLSAPAPKELGDMELPPVALGRMGAEESVMLGLLSGFVVQEIEFQKIFDFQSGSSLRRVGKVS